MNEQELRRYLPNASASLVRLNATERAEDFPSTDSGKAAELERDLRNGTLGEVQSQRRLGKRFLVCITSVRKRLLDEDNLCEKYIVDCCRHAGLIPDDSPGTTKIEVSQRKAEPGQEEHVIVEIFAL